MPVRNHRANRAWIDVPEAPLDHFLDAAHAVLYSETRQSLLSSLEFYTEGKPYYVGSELAQLEVIVMPFVTQRIREKLVAVIKDLEDPDNGKELPTDSQNEDNNLAHFIADNYPVLMTDDEVRELAEVISPFYFNGRKYSSEEVSLYVATRINERDYVMRGLNAEVVGGYVRLVYAPTSEPWY